MNKLVSKWEKTGLLENLSTPKKTKCAVSLEKLGNLLVKKYGGNMIKGSESVCGVILPVMRRLYDERVRIPTGGWLLKDFLKFCKTHPESDVTKIDPRVCRQCTPNDDPEAECINNYIKNVTVRLKQRKS